MNLTGKVSGTISIEILVNFVLPYLIYAKVEDAIGQAHALMAASLPPILWSVVEFARKRRVDAVSVLVIAGIVLSLLAFLGGGSVRFLQLRENLVTGLVGLVFLASAAIGRPLIYQLARAGKLRESKSEAEKFERLRDYPSFRRGMALMTLVWGFGLFAQTAVACLLVFHMTIRHYLIVSPILGYGTMGLLALWTFLYVRRMKRRGEAARLAAKTL
ncbi:MAG: VC0807 family protein [Acidobacteriaceae bacterium]